MVTECAFGQLKSRWRVLYKKCEHCKDTVKSFALACIVLHNICLKKGDTLSGKLDLTIDPTSHQRQERNTVRNLLQMRRCTKIENTNKKDNQIRIAIFEYFWNERMSVQNSYYSFEIVSTNHILQ